jgi:hypothetical protein
LREVAADKIRYWYTQLSKKDSMTSEFEAEYEGLFEKLKEFLASPDAANVGVLSTRFHDRQATWEGEDPEDFDIGEYGLYLVVYLLAASMYYFEIESVDGDFTLSERLMTPFSYCFVLAMIKTRPHVVKPPPAMNGKASVCDKIVDPDTGVETPLTTWLYAAVTNAQVIYISNTLSDFYCVRKL